MTSDEILEKSCQETKGLLHRAKQVVKQQDAEIIRMRSAGFWTRLKFLFTGVV